MELESKIDEDFKTSATRFREQGGPPDEVAAYIADFKNLKAKIQDPDRKDIDKWKEWEQFKTYVDQLKQTKSKGQQKKEKKLEGAQLVTEDKYWRVYKITTHDAAKLYGSGTQWCITQADGDYWDRYSNSIFFFYISKRLPPSSPFYKIALQFDPESDKPIEYWDAKDRNYGHGENDFYRRRGGIPFKLPMVPEIQKHLDDEKQRKADAEAEKEENEPMHSVYLNTGTVISTHMRDQILALDPEASSIPMEGPTVEGDYFNLHTDDEEVVKKVIGVIGKDKVKEVAPELTSESLSVEVNGRIYGLKG